MTSEKPPCTQEECKQKSKQFVFLPLQELAEQLKACEQCHNGLFKANAIASKTYELITTLWAEKHNQVAGKLR